ncbi:MAG: T9SS type A sorting domain-containing protein [Bacteroidetes bacterium]|nr:MAG: T9SS type A sorting domain-containing protein [Bacteroidota bacterium]
MKTKLLLYLLIILGEIAHTQIGSMIPSNHRVDWRNPGYEGNIPRQAQNYVNVKTQYIDGEGLNATDAFVTAIADANTWNSNHPGELSMLYFPEGYYALSSDINLQSNIIIKGDGSDRTLFSFTDNGLKITGSSNPSYANIQNYTQATKTLVISGDIGVQNGQLIEITVPNGWWHKPDEDGNEYVGQIVKVQNANGETLVLEDDIYLVWLMEGSANKAKVRIFTPIQQVGIEDIKIVSSGLNNTHISINSAANCWISGVESQNPGLHHIGIHSSYRIEVRGCYFREAKKVCVNGQGYGVHIGYHSTNCLIEDNIFRKLRHSMIAYAGATRNVFGFNYSGDRRADDPDGITGSCVEMNGVEADLLFHGRYPIANLTEGNVVDYIAGEVIHGINGQYNTVFRNRTACNDVSLSRAYGGIRFYEYESGGCQLFNSYGNTLTDIDDQDYCCGVSDGYNGQNSMGDNAYSDISYYYESQPQFLAASGLSWPPVGTRVGPLLSQTNPAEMRWWGGNSKKTVQASSPYYLLELHPSQCVEDGSVQSAIYHVNNIPTNSIYLSNAILTVTPPDGYGFHRWSDGNEDNPRQIVLSGATTLYAELKQAAKSTDVDGYKQHGNRKVVKTTNGVLHNVYESLGKVWYEYSSNNGVSWSIADKYFVGKGNGSSIAAVNSNAVIVAYYTSNLQDGGIHFKLFQDGHRVDLPIPSIPTNYANRRLSLAAVRDNATTYPKYHSVLVGICGDDPGNQSGIILKTFSLKEEADQSISLWDGQGVVIIGDQYADNLSIDGIAGYDHNSSDPKYMLAWERTIESNIYFVNISIVADKDNSQLVNKEIYAPYQPINISNGSGYYYNTMPSIIYFHPGPNSHQARISWIGRRWIPIEEWLEKTNGGGDEGYWEEVMVTKHVHPTTPGTFSVYGDAVVANDIQKVTLSGSIFTSDYIIATSSSLGGNAYVCNYVGSNATNVLGVFSNQGPNIRPINDYPVTDPKSMVYTSATPYNLLFTGKSMNQNKSNGGLFSGRELIVTKDSASIYFSVNNIKVRSNNIALKECDDTNTIRHPYYGVGIIESGPIFLSDVNDLSLNVSYGITDSIRTATVLRQGDTIKFSLIIADYETKAILGELGEIIFAKNDFYKYSSVEYQYDIAKQGGRNVIIVVSEKDNIGGLLTGAVRILNDKILEKRNSKHKKVIRVGEGRISEYSLESNFPNPFNPSTTISYALPQDGLTTLKVYDALGREVAELVNEFKPTGRYTASFDASRLSSGVYVYRLVSDKYSAVKKMLLLK